nr:hypothetical protein [Candidatus Njordarchaeota archaeon]
MAKIEAEAYREEEVKKSEVGMICPGREWERGCRDHGSPSEASGEARWRILKHKCLEHM